MEIVVKFGDVLVLDWYSRLRRAETGLIIGVIKQLWYFNSQT